MIYCCVKVAYVLLKVRLVNDRACVEHCHGTGSCVFSCAVGERQSEPAAPQPHRAARPPLPLHAGTAASGRQPVRVLLGDRLFFLPPASVEEGTVLHNSFGDVLGLDVFACLP